MRATARCLLVCLLCTAWPSIGHAGPIADALAEVSAQRATGPPSTSRQRIWAGGIVLTVMGGWMIIFGENRKKRSDDELCGVAFFSSCSVSDPNRALSGAGAAAVGAGIIMIILGRDKSSPQIIATPGKLAIQHTVRF